jgi:glutamate carboxypeptidase
MELPALRDLLVRWSEINSGSDHPAGLARMRAALGAEFSSLTGAIVDDVPLPGTAARALRVRQRPTAPIQLLLSGHYDTVYGADHPFQKCDQPDVHTLRGPGVADMKGGLVVLLAALREFEHTPAAARVGYEILLTPDEETGSVASRALLEAAAPRFQLALIFEPARENGDIVQSRKGTGIFTATCHGRAAHAGRDAREGRNAVVALAEFLVAAHRLPGDYPGVLLNVGSIRGGGAVNIVPDLARAEINLRITRADDAPRVLDRLRALAGPINAREGFRLELAGQFNRLPLEAGPVTTAMFAAYQQCARDLSLPAPGWTHVGGGSDGNLLSAAGLPCLDGLGPIGGHLHSAEEYINLPSLVERTRIAARFLTKLATGEIVLPPR